MEAHPIPPRYQPDTNIVIQYARGGDLAKQMEARYSLRASANLPIVSIVTIGEVRAFAMCHNWGVAKLREAQHILDVFVVVSLDFPGVLDAYAELKTYSETVGRSMGDNDLWIAATAKVTGALLLTTDKDFDHLNPMHIRRDWIDPNTR